VLRVTSAGRRSRVLARWRSSRGLVGLLVVCGVPFAAGGMTLSFATDTRLYERYARAALASPLLHSMPREYPALALAIFLAPMSLPLPYALGFALLAAVACLFLVLCSDGFRGEPGWSRRTCYYLLIGSTVVVFARYDVFPALTAVLAVEASRRQQWGRAWAWGVLGGLLKLFPFLLLPGFLVVERAQTGRWAIRRLWTVCLPLGAMALAQYTAAPASLTSPLRFQIDRGFELSSLQGSLAFLSDPLHAHWISGYGSVELASRGQLVIALLVSVVAAVSLLTMWALAFRGRLSVVAVSLAVLSIAVLSEKSFAPQYLVWLAPFWAYWPIRRGWVVAALLTTLVYPVLYAEAYSIGPNFYLATAVAAGRNAVLIAATVGWLLTELRPVRDNGQPVGAEVVSEELARPPVLPTTTVQTV
jgi:hypothetical protein